MMRDGCLGVAIVSRRVMVVQAARSHTRRDWPFLDVYTFVPFSADRVFLATNVPKARITTSDILTIFPPDDILRTRNLSEGMLQLPEEAFAEFIELRSRTQERYTKIWNALALSR
ncbi:capping protein [Favolaschia claudopus]|uniref:Capping protein n=1 Tax=Favolaschia claudopus TaxID=2862362 RepID=A0AAW0BWW8_9AGAR